MVGVKDSPVAKNLLEIPHNDETWYSYTLPKEDPKNICDTLIIIYVTHDISISSPEFSSFCYIEEYR